MTHDPKASTCSSQLGLVDPVTPAMARAGARLKRRLHALQIRDGRDIVRQAKARRRKRHPAKPERLLRELRALIAILAAEGAREDGGAASRTTRRRGRPRRRGAARKRAGSSSSG